MYTRALELDPMNIHTLGKYAVFLRHKRGELVRAESFFIRALQICLPNFAKTIEKSIKSIVPSSSTDGTGENIAIY
jgi:hypothetical protein